MSGSECAATVCRWTLLFWLTALVPFGYAADPPPASQSELSAEAAAIKAETLKVADRLVRQFPRDPKAVCLLGTVYNSQGNATEAVALWNRCLKLNPRWTVPYNCLATTALQRGDHDEAIALWRKAKEIDPHMEMAHDRMAEALMQLGKTAEVIELLEKHVAVNEQAGVSHYWLGQAYMQSKEYEKAKKHYRATIAVQPEFYPAYYGLAKVASRQRDTEAAAEYRKEFARRKAEFLKTKNDERAIYDDMQSLRGALARTYTDAGLVYQNHGYMWQVEKHWKKAATVDPANTACRQRLVAFYQQQEPYQQEALEIIRELIELHPEAADYYLQTGVIHGRLRNFDDAEKAFRKVCELAPEKAIGYLSLAQLYHQEDRKLTEATKLAAKAVQLDPTALNYFVLGCVYQKNDELAKAQSAIGRALELDPDNREYRKMFELVQGKP